MGSATLIVLFALSFISFQFVCCSREMDGDEFPAAIKNSHHRMKRGFLSFDEISKLRDGELLDDDTVPLSSATNIGSSLGGVGAPAAGNPLKGLPSGSIIDDSVLRKAPKIPVGGLDWASEYEGDYDDDYYSNYKPKPPPAAPKKPPKAPARPRPRSEGIFGTDEIRRHTAEIRKTKKTADEIDFKVIDEALPGGAGAEPRAANDKGLLLGDNGIRKSSFPKGIPQFCQRGVKFTIPFNFKDTKDGFGGYHVVAADAQDLNTLKAFLTGTSNRVTFGDNPKIKLNVAGTKHKLTGFGSGSVVVDCSEQHTKKTDNLCVTEAGDPAFTPFITHTDNETYAFIVRCYANQSISPGWFLISTKPEAVSEEKLKILKQHLKELGLDSNRIYLQEFDECRRKL